MLMGDTIIESERLLLRKFTPEDAGFIVELVNTEGWIKYIGNKKISNVDQAKDYLNNGPLKSYQVNGFGLWLVQEKSTGRPVGMCGLIKRDSLPNIDIGFALLPGYSKQGYAYEIAKKTLQYAFEQLQQETILAITLPDNQSSIRLLEKLGMKYIKDFTSKDTTEQLALYEIKK